MTTTANFDTRIVIWGMDSSLSLEDFLPLLMMNYDAPIDYLEDHQVDMREKTLLNGWRPFNGEEFLIDSLEIQGVEVKYISAIGLYETAISSTKAIVEGRLLPRTYRVFNRTVNAVFFEIHKRVYAVLEVSSSQENRVRSVLFGQGYKYKKPEWGKVSTKEMPQYSLDSKFFYWIFSKRGQELNIDWGNSTANIKILDVSAVSQYSDRNVHDNRNEGPDVLGSLPALSGLGKNQNVYEGGFQFLIDDVHLFCRFTSNSTCTLDSGRSIITRGERVTPIIEAFPRLAVTVYTILIPGLLASFHKESNPGGSWTSKEEEKQRKFWALKVIKELSYDNNITLEDMENLFENHEEE